MVFRRLERMLFETGMYFGLPAAKIAGIYEMVRGIMNHNELTETVSDPHFLAGAGVYAAANAASWLSYKILNRIVVKENQEKLNNARQRMDRELQER